MMTLEWTEEHSRAVDLWAAGSVRVPLQRDPKLWELLAEDRKQAPRPYGRAGRPLVCRDCRRPMRDAREPDDGRVIHKCRGLCPECVRIRKDLGIKLPPMITHTDALPCNECGTLMYPRQAKDRPADQVRYYAKGMCEKCYKHNRRCIPMSCTGCGTNMRPGTRRPDEYTVDTVPHAGHGMCHACIEKHRGTARFSKARRPDNCLDCKRTMRPCKVKINDQPDTVIHHAHGLCRGCWQKRRRRELV